MENNILNNFKEYLHDVDVYEYNNLKIIKYSDKIEFSLNNLNFTFKQNDFCKIIENKYGKIKYNDNLFQINKQNKKDDDTLLILKDNNNEVFTRININSYQFNHFLNHLKNVDEICFISQDSKTNQITIILGLKDDYLNLNIHNLFYILMSL